MLRFALPSALPKANAYTLFMNAKRATVLEKLQKEAVRGAQTCPVVTKEAAAMWKALTDTERAVFQDESQYLHQEWDEQKVKFYADELTPEKAKQPPKMPPDAFGLFVEENRTGIKKKLGENGANKGWGVTKEGKKFWDTEMMEDTKEDYETRAAELLEKWKVDMQAFLDKLPPRQVTRKKDQEE